MPALKDFTPFIGKKKSFITVVGIESIVSSKIRRTVLRCKCKCGKTCLVPPYVLNKRENISCGCLKNELTSKRAKTHGKSKTNVYHIYYGIIQRCENPNTPGYAEYGGRGIKMCKRWRNKFEHFIKDMGDRPSLLHSVDRINNNGNYSPSNCRWATSKEQNSNKRSNRYIEYDNQKLTVTQWSEKTGIAYKVIQSRLNYNWSVEDIFTIPVGAYKTNHLLKK